MGQQAMTKEQLLQPRYMCTGTPGKPLWYGCHWKHGDIIKLDQTVDGLVCIYEDYKGRHFVKELYFSDYPHLFRPLQWWEYRKPEEMPEYVITNYKDSTTGDGLRNGAVFKVEKWVTETFIGVDGLQLFAHIEGYKPSWLIRFPQWQNGRVNACHLTPATEEEYETYLRQKEG